jgi:hypothetical protein
MNIFNDNDNNLFYIDFPQPENGETKPSANSLKEASHNLLVGDLIFEKAKGKSIIFSPVDAAIIILQKMASKLNRFSGKKFNLDTHSTKIYHVYQIVEIDKVTGQVLLADAMPAKNEKLRIIDLWQDHSTKLTSSSKFELEVIRLNDQQLANDTATKVKGLALKSTYLLNEEEKQERIKERKRVGEKKKQSSFSLKKGLKAIFKKPSAEISQKEMKRLMKKAMDEILVPPDTVSGGKKEPKKFFCSYFISDQLMGSQLLSAFQNVYENLAIDKQKQIDKLIEEAVNGIDNILKEATDDFKKRNGKMELTLDEMARVKKTVYRNQNGHLSHLAEKLTDICGENFLEELNKMEGIPKIEVEVTIKGKTEVKKRIIDPKHTSPQMLFEVLNNPALGKKVGIIIPPRR